METPTPQWGPKVHPASRLAEAEDPLHFTATPLPGDAVLMLECLVGEYAREGWDADRIRTLFRDPFYPALHELWRHFGEEGIRARVEALLRRTGVFRCGGFVAEEPDEDEPELIELNLKTQPRSS